MHTKKTVKINGRKMNRAAITWHLLLSIEGMTRELRRLLFGKPPKLDPDEATIEGKAWYGLLVIEHTAGSMRKTLFPKEAKT